MARKHVRQEGEKVHWQGKSRFFGGEVRSLLHDVDEKVLLKAILEERARQNKYTGEVSVVWDIDGHKVKFTQTQARSLLFHVEEVV